MYSLYISITSNLSAGQLTKFYSIFSIRKEVEQINPENIYAL